jgi:hypothetical protein
MFDDVFASVWAQVSSRRSGAPAGGDDRANATKVREPGPPPPNASPAVPMSGMAAQVDRNTQ